MKFQCVRCFRDIDGKLYAVARFQNANTTMFDAVCWRCERDDRARKTPFPNWLNTLPENSAIEAP